MINKSLINNAYSLISSRLNEPFEKKLLDAAFYNLKDSGNPIHFNNFAYVFRQLFYDILDRIAPSKKVIKAKWFKPMKTKEPHTATREQQILLTLLNGVNKEFIIKKLNLACIFHTKAYL